MSSKKLSKAGSKEASDARRSANSRYLASLLEASAASRDAAASKRRGATAGVRAAGAAAASLELKAARGSGMVKRAHVVACTRSPVLWLARVCAVTLCPRQHRCAQEHRWLSGQAGGAVAAPSRPPTSPTSKMREADESHLATGPGCAT
jgi:hypothetical protein